MYSRLLDGALGIVPDQLFPLAEPIHRLFTDVDPVAEALAAAAITVDRGHVMRLDPGDGEHEPPRFVFADNDDLESSPVENAAFKVLKSHDLFTVRALKFSALRPAVSGRTPLNPDVKKDFLVRPFQEILFFVSSSPD